MIAMGREVGTGSGGFEGEMMAGLRACGSALLESESVLSLDTAGVAADFSS